MWLTKRSTPTSDVIVLIWGEGTSGALCYDPACPTYQLGTLLYRPTTTWNTGHVLKSTLIVTLPSKCHRALTF